MILIAGGRIGGYAVRIHGAEATGQVVLVERKRVYFDFDERFGPLVVDPQGEPMKRQPIREDHPFWEPFEAWLAGYWKAKMDGALDAYLDAHHGTRQRVTPRHGNAHRAKAAQSSEAPTPMIDRAEGERSAEG